MKSPEFSAEASLYKTTRQYCTSGATVDASNTLQPATLGSFILPSFCPPDPCRNLCLSCKRGCLNLVGNAKGECLRDYATICD
jgi:hypothetical protein